MCQNFATDVQFSVGAGRRADADGGTCFGGIENVWQRGFDCGCQCFPAQQCRIGAGLQQLEAVGADEQQSGFVDTDLEYSW